MARCAPCKGRLTRSAALTVAVGTTFDNVRQRTPAQAAARGRSLLGLEAAFPPYRENALRTRLQTAASSADECLAELRRLDAQRDGSLGASDRLMGGSASESASESGSDDGDALARGVFGQRFKLGRVGGPRGPGGR